MSAYATVSPSEQVGREEIEDILFVCTGNLCRSPMAAELLRSSLAERPHVRIRSAGFLGKDRRPTKQAIRVMRGRGINLAGHLSSSVLTSLETAPDLVLVMTRQQLGTLVELDGRLLTRTFTLREFVRLAEVEGPRRPGEALRDYVESVRRGRGGSASVASWTDDITDPMGKRKSAYESCAQEIAGLVELLSAHLYPEPRRLSTKDRI